MMRMALFRRAKKAEAEQMLPIYPQEIFEAGLLDLKDVLAPSAFEVSPSDMRLGQKFVQTIFVFSYPRFLATNWFSGVLNLDKEFDVSLFVHPVDTAMMLRRLRKKVAEVQSQITEREEKGLVRDPMLDTAYRDLEDLRDKLMQAREHLFSFGLYITIYSDSKRGTQFRFPAGNGSAEREQLYELRSALKRVPVHLF